MHHLSFLYRVYFDVTSPLEHTPTVGLSGKTSVNMPGFSGGNCEHGSKTNDDLLKLKAVGLNSDTYNLTRYQWSMDIDS